MIGTPAERAVIGSALLDQRVIPFIEKELTGADFSVGQYEQIWDGLLRMRSAQQAIDVITVSGKLAEWNVRGVDPVDLHNIVSETPHAHSAGQYAANVRAESLRRKLRITGSDLLRRADALDVVPGETVAKAIEDLRQIQANNTRESLGAKPLQDVLNGKDLYDWAIPNLLERKDRLILTGAEGAGKSTFVRQMAILSAAGIHPTTFDWIDPLKVLVIDAENSEQQWRRAARNLALKAKKYGQADPGQNVTLVCSPRLDITRDSHLGQVHKLIDEYDPAVVFIGPLYRLTPRAINSDDDAAPLLAALDTIRDRNIALVMEAHAGHAVGVGGERDLRPRGSAALMGWPEFGMGIKPSKVDKYTFHVVRWRGDRDEREWPEVMKRGGEWPWTVSVSV